MTASSPASVAAELLPCPFCGGRPAITIGFSRAGVKTVDVICQECSGAMLAFCKEDAVEDWNTRENLNATPADPISTGGRPMVPEIPFDPTNHHNALKCPYCNPQGLQFASTGGREGELSGNITWTDWDGAAYTDQPIFDALASATSIDKEPDGFPRVVISASKFIETFNNHRDRDFCTSLRLAAAPKRAEAVGLNTSPAREMLEQIAEYVDPPLTDGVWAGTIAEAVKATIEDLESKADVAVKALEEIRAAIVEADPNVLTCTLWMPGHISMGETVVDRIEARLEALLNAKALAGIRSLVAGWNGEGKPEPFSHRHPDKLGARIDTNCGAIYELDDLMKASRTVVGQLKDNGADA